MSRWFSLFIKEMNCPLSESVYFQWCLSVWGYEIVACVLGFFIVSCVYRRRGGDDVEAAMLFVLGSFVTAIAFPMFPILFALVVVGFVWHVASKPPVKPKQKPSSVPRKDPVLIEAEKEVESFLKENQENRRVNVSC
jgi:hypothetical protein